MAAHKHDPEYLFEHDEQLKPHHAALAHWLKPASDADIQTTVDALKAKHAAQVHVVNTRKDALAALVASIPKGSSMSSAGSQTLVQIGYSEWAKTQDIGADYKAAALKAEAAGDWPAANESRRQGLSADVFITSVSALTKEGELYAVDLSGSRTGGFLASKNLIVVAGSNKIVADHAAAVKRTREFCLPVESARVRDAYKVPASAITNTVSMSTKSPFSQNGRLTVILIKESAGF